MQLSDTNLAPLTCIANTDTTATLSQAAGTQATIVYANDIETYVCMPCASAVKHVDGSGCPALLPTLNLNDNNA